MDRNVQDCVFEGVERAGLAIRPGYFPALGLRGWDRSGIGSSIPTTLRRTSGFGLWMDGKSQGCLK